VRDFHFLDHTFPNYGTSFLLHFHRFYFSKKFSGTFLDFMTSK